MDAEPTPPPKAQDWLLRVIRVAEILAQTQDETDEEAVESTDTHPAQRQKTQN
jgi:hypothetical protein